MDAMHRQLTDQVLDEAKAFLEQDITLPHVVTLHHAIESTEGKVLKSEVTFRRRPCLGDVKHLDIKRPSIKDLAAVAAGMSGEPDWVFDKMDLEDAVRCGGVVMRFLPFFDRIGGLLSVCLRES